MLMNVSHVLPIAKISRLRVLPVPGKVLVRAGQNVDATDVIAEAVLHPEHITLDVARGLGVERSKANRFIQRDIGEDVSSGSVIANRPGLGRVVRAPSGGKLVAISGGKVLLQVNSKPYQLKATIPGSVHQVEADFGAVIETNGSWVQGIWGNGKLNVGTLETSAEDPSEVLKAENLDPSQRGSIILSGHCNDRKTLEALKKLQMNGLIIGSLPTQLLPIATRMPYPIVITDGFGKLPMNKSAFELLASNVKRHTTLNATILNRIKGEFPEIIIPLESSANAPIPVDLEKLRVGLLVRILKSPYAGAVGTLNRLLTGQYRFPGGLRAEAAEVLFDNEETTIVPLANIEVLG